MIPRLSAEHLCVMLGGREVLSGIDLALDPGLFTVVIGPNGAGKTTLLRTFAGLLRLHRGAAKLAGTPISSLAARERARALAYLPQDGGVFWPLSVASVVALGRIPHAEQPDRLSEAGRQAVADAIRSVGIQGFEHRRATELSGGERARVLLARALATQAPVLLADEPVAALDPKHQLIVLDVLKARARAGDLVLAVMHDLPLVARAADRVILLDEGRVVALGPPAAVLTEPRLAASFGVKARVRIEQGRPVVSLEGAIL